MRRLVSPRRRTQRHFVVPLLASAILGAACGRDRAPDPTPAGPVVGPGGGTVTDGGGAEVVVPPGALEGDLTIRVAKDSTGAPALPPELAGAGDTYMITPHGGDFAVPVAVRIPVPGLTVQPNEVLKLAKAQPGGGWMVLGDTVLRDGLLEAQVRSFSFFRVVVVRYPSVPVPGTSSEPFTFGQFTFQCDGRPCADPEILRPMKVTATVTNNGGQLPSSCADPKFWMTDYLGDIGWITPVPVTPGTTTRVEFDLHGNLAAIIRAHRFEAFGWLLCSGPVPPGGLTGDHVPYRIGYAAIELFAGATSPSVPFVVQFPPTLTYAVGQEPTLRPVLQGGGAFISDSLDYSHYANWDQRFQGPTVYDHAIIHLERLGPTDTVWRTVASRDQLDADRYPFGTATPEWMYWSVDFALAPLTLADSGALYQVRACFKGRDEPVETCQVGPTARLTVLQQLQPPAYTQQPRPMLITPGQTASLDVVAGGVPAPTFQWQTRPADGAGEWTDVTRGTGGTTAHYTTPPVSLGEDGVQYRVLATNAAGTTASRFVAVFVTAAVEAPTLVWQPTDLTVVGGSEALFAAAARGTEALSYQWRKDDVPIAGANSPQLKIANATASDAGVYTVVVSNVAGTVVSNGAALSVTSASTAPVAPSIVTQPAGVAVTEGNVATFAVGVSGSDPLSFQWRKDGADIAGAVAAAHTIQAVAAGDAGNYSVRITNTAGSVVSQAATLAVAPAGAPAVVAPTITTQPAGLVVAPGGTATLAVAATGSGPLAFQWSLDGTPVAGATEPVLRIASVTALEAGSYTVAVGNAAGTVVSAPALLVLLGAPAITTQPAGATVAEGAAASFSVGATGSGLRYEWLRNGAAIAGAVAASYTTPATTLADGGAVFSVLVYNGAGLVVSQGAALTVTAAPAGKVWGNAELLEDNVGDATRPQVALNASGNGMAVWQHDGAVQPSIWASHYTAGSGWGAPLLIETDDTDSALSPQVAVDGAGNALAVWSSGSGVIWSNRYDAAAASWGSAVALGNGSMQKVVFDPLGNAMAVWNLYLGGTVNVWVDRYVAGAGWAGAAAIFDVGSSGGAPDLAFDADGNAWLVALHWNGVRTNVHAKRYRVATNTWDAPVLIESDDAGITQAPQVAIDTSGNAVALWTQFDGTRYDIRASHSAAGTGTWSTAVLSLTAAAGGGDAPQVGFDAAGNALAVWAQADGPLSSIWSNRYTPGVGWGTAELIETGGAGDAALPQIAIDAAGNAFAVWYQSNGTLNDVWVNRYTAGSGWGTPALLEALAGQALRPQVAVDGSGNAIAAWDQSDGTRISIWAASFR